jgi:hypothetical protein
LGWPQTPKQAHGTLHCSRCPPHIALPTLSDRAGAHQALPLRGSSQGHHAFQRWRSSRRQDSKSSRTLSLLVHAGITDSISPPRNFALSFNSITACQSATVRVPSHTNPQYAHERPNALPHLQHQATRLELRATPGLQQHLVGVITKLFDRYVGTAGHVLVPCIACSLHSDVTSNVVVGHNMPFLVHMLLHLI